MSNKTYTVDVYLSTDKITGKRKRIVRKDKKTLQSAKNLEQEICNLNEEGIYYNGMI